MAFDPDEYLNETGASSTATAEFDPDAYLKETEEPVAPFDPDAYLTETETPEQPAQPQAPVGTSIGAEIAAIPQALKQAVGQPLEAIGETAEVLGAPSVGAAFRGAIEEPVGYVSAAQRFMQPQEGEFQIGGFAPQFLPRAIVEQAGQIGGAILTRAAGMAVGGLAGSALGPKGTVAGSVTGAFLGPALFEMSQIVGPVARERASNQGREQPNTDDLAWAWGTAGASGALNAIGAKYLPNGDKLVGGLASRIATAVAGEGTTEGLQNVVQQTGQTFLTEQGFELEPKQVIGEAVIGGGAAGGAVALAAPFTPRPETKAVVAADTKIAAEQAAPVAPETAQIVSEQANQVIAQAQAEEQAETPEQRVARLQREAQAAAEIPLEEEEVAGLPPVEPTPPVTPTPEAAVAPVEPVVAAEGAVEPTVTEAPAETITEAFAQMGEGAVDSYYQAVLQSLQESGEVPTPERRSNVGQAWERVRGQMTPEEFVVQLRQNAEDPSKIQAPEAATAAVELTPVTPPVTPQLEPLRRVARAEQTEEDVAGLVDAGFVEVYNGQPVITQAGLEALPEAERPRLTPEARKIQIDTRTSEAAAEAISKNLRIGVDQVPVDVRMPAGWTLVGDIYVPPQPQAVTPTPTPEVREARREPPVEIQQQYAPKTDEERESFDRASTNKILSRSPQLAVAAVRLKNGEITAGEYADLVDVLDPFVVKGAEPVPTNEKIYQYMSQTAGGKPTSEQGKKKLAKIGAFKEDGTQRIPNGKLAEFRIDIPTYNESTKNGDTVYSITGHEPVSETATSVGETIAHLGIAKVTNPQFITRTISGKGDAIQIAMGAGKFPLATVKGNYEAITELPADINDPNVWTETGYNPVRSSELVDVRSKKALVGGTEAIMVGSRVFVKNAQLEARPTGITMGERYARRVQMGRAGMEQSAVEARLQELGFPTGGIIRVVNEPDADFEGRTIILDGKVTGIELNAAAMRDNATIDRVLNHEFAESANADGALNRLVERLTPKEKKEINDTITRLRYEERARTAEEAARAIETLAEAWKGRGFFTRAVARVEAWASKLGFKLTRRAAEYIAARNLADINLGFRTAYNQTINVTTEAGQEIRASRRETEAIPTFTEGTPEAATLKEMATSMAKVDAASEAKGGKPETYKISEIASVWMDSGLGERELQDAIVEYTNLTPANAARVAKAIARQYDIQQSIATAFLETQTGLSVEALPEGVTLPKEVDPDRPRPVMQRLFDVFMGVRVPPTKLTVNEKAALKDQIRLKAAANRAAKAAQKETSDQVIEVIKAMDLRGGVRPKQVQALAKRAAKVIWTNEKSVETFTDYAAKVVENANYDADLREAKAAQARAKQLSKQKKIAAPQRKMLDNISKIPVNRLDDPRMYADAVNYYLRGFKAVLSPDYVVIPDSEMTSYLSQMESEATRSQKELDSAVNQRLAEKYGVDPDDVNKVLEAVEIIKQIEANENREAMDNLLTDKAIETQDGLKAYDQTPLRPDQRKVVDFMMKVDPRALDAEERQRFIRITNNIIYNNQTNGAEYFVSVAKGQQNARAAAQDSAMIAKNKAWINLLPRFISERMQRGWALELQSVADTFRNAFGKGAMAKVYKAMGMLDLNMGFTKANNTIDEIQEKIAEFHRGLEKKYKAAARNQDGLLAEGVAGFLIQAVPNKGETESIAQRRDLIKQDIANRRESGEADRIAMADRIEAILNQIDGEGIQAVLNKLKQTYPANYESLVWYKDTLFPQYKDFLKNFDENFNDQANNYDNPNYLPIAFSKASPSLAITPEEEQVFFDQVSLTPKQSAYTIKRVDYTTLPTDRTTKRPKEIEFNLRRNAFDSLSDQINKAYTSGAWQQIASFMKTPEAKVVFGGQANQDFFIERLNRLRLSRMRRGAMSRGNIERAVDSLSVISRKLGTGIALGGIYQWIKQPPDQLVTALGSGGRYDLMAQNIMPKNQKAARELLRKFSIGRRGDASAGYKYINQMEGHQNRLERYFSESKWDQVKEEGGKIADVWMAALKQSDFWAASTAWMTYYEGELNKRNIKIEDWAKEEELVDTDPARQEAAAFAEQMTDIYQGSSDPTQMATFAQSGKSGWENLMKAIFVPFNSFAIQQRMRLYSDARDVLNGEKSGVGGLSGTIGGLLLFHATKRLALPVISGGIATILYGLLGVDMDEPDEEKQKEEANKRWRQMQGEMLGNLLVGGTPQIVEAKFIDAMNYASYLIALQLESEDILNDDGEIITFDQYAKERSPFWRYRSFDNAMSLGMLDIGLGQAEQAILQTKMIATPEEMEMYTPEEQRLLYFSALSEWLYLMRLNDADFARIVTKARRDMVSAAKEREKEIKRIREGR